MSKIKCLLLCFFVFSFLTFCKKNNEDNEVVFYAMELKSYSISGENFIGGDVFSLKLNIENISQNEYKLVSYNFYISKDKSYNYEEDYIIKSPIFPILKRGLNEIYLNLQIPVEKYKDKNYYIAFEYKDPGDPKTVSKSFYIPVEISKALETISGGNLRMSSESSYSGLAVNVGFSLKNTYFKNLEVLNELYFSDDRKIDNDDFRVYANYITGKMVLEMGVNNFAGKVMIPDVNKTRKKYLISRVRDIDSSVVAVFVSDNNIGITNPISVGSSNFSPKTIKSNDNLYLNNFIKNIQDSTINYTIRHYISNDRIFDTKDYYFSESSGQISGNSTINVNAFNTSSLSWLKGKFYIISTITVGNNINESLIIVGDQIKANVPDTEAGLTFVSANSFLSKCSLMYLQYSFESTSSNDCEIKIKSYLSKDNILDSNDYNVNQSKLSISKGYDLSVNKSYSTLDFGMVKAQLPIIVAPSNYFLITMGEAECGMGNNFKFQHNQTPFVIDTSFTGPVINFFLTIDKVTALLEAISFTYSTVCNSSDVQYYADFYLSNDKEWSSDSDILIATDKRIRNNSSQEIVFNSIDIDFSKINKGRYYLIMRIYSSRDLNKYTIVSKNYFDNE